jgi:hypothetical protein
MIKLRQSEIDRACEGYTIITRPQSGGGVMVATVWVETKKIVFSEIVRNGEIQTEIRQQLRMLDKLGGCWPMANKSRHRTGKKFQERLDSGR